MYIKKANKFILVLTVFFAALLSGAILFSVAGFSSPAADSVILSDAQLNVEREKFFSSFNQEVAQLETVYVDASGFPAPMCQDELNELARYLAALPSYSSAKISKTLLTMPLP